MSDARSDPSADDDLPVLTQVLRPGHGRRMPAALAATSRGERHRWP